MRRSNMIPYHLDVFLFFIFLFFSHSNFPFQSYRPGHPNPQKSIPVLWSYLVTPYYLPPPFPSTPFPSQLSTSFPLSPLCICVPLMGEVQFCPLSQSPMGIWLCVSSHDWHAYLWARNAQTFPSVPDLPACRQRVCFLIPPQPLYRCCPDLTIRNNVVGDGNKCWADSSAETWQTGVNWMINWTCQPLSTSEG